MVSFSSLMKVENSKRDKIDFTWVPIRLQTNSQSI